MQVIQLAFLIKYLATQAYVAMSGNHQKTSLKEK